MIVNPVAGGWHPSNADSWGGGEEAIVLWTRALAARGHSIMVEWDGTEYEDGPVRYLPYGRTPSPDVLVYRKTPEQHHPGRTALDVLWTDQVRSQPVQPFARIVLASHFLRRSFAGMFEAAAPRIAVIPDGYDPTAFPDPMPAHDPSLVLHASSPDRGLTTLLSVWPDVVAARPTARLLVAYGWEIFLRCGGSLALKAEVDAAIAAMPSVTMERLTFAGIHDAYARAGVWAYYCTATEAFCQAAIKAQMAGAVPVTRPWGAMHETVWSGLRGHDPASFRDALIEALDPERQAALRTEIAPLGTPWADVAEQWETLLTTAQAEPLPPASPSALVQVPDTPTDLVPDYASKVTPAVHQIASQWLGQIRAQRPWFDPTLGIQGGAIPEGTVPDALVLGFALEDVNASPQAILDQYGARAGQWLMLVTSLGPWRKRGYRTWQRRDMQEVFGQQPDLGNNVVPFDGEGSALCFTTFRYDPTKLGTRNMQRVRSLLPARQTLAACLISPPRQSDVVLWRALGSLEPIVDEVVIGINGTPSLDGGPAFCDTAALADAWARKTGIPVTIVPSHSPRWCFDCGAEHAVGQVEPGHRVAGFETPRNQSIAPVRADHVIWLDTDEVVLHAERLAKFLRPNVFVGLGIGQDHFSSDPPAAYKRDTPMRVFRATRDGSEPGFYAYGPEQWPTFNPGLTARFGGLVHEHPGGPPLYTEGWGPVLMVPDVFIAHSGYYTEAARRGRFVRNWPLMVADRAKYPGRRLGLFLWLRDLAQQLRYLIDRNGGRVTPEGVQYANAAWALYVEHFATSAEAYSADAVQYGTVAAQVLGKGIEVAVQVQAKKPEISGDEAVQFGFAGRIADPAQLVAYMQAQVPQLERWTGKYL